MVKQENKLASLNKTKFLNKKSIFLLEVLQEKKKEMLTRHQRKKGKERIINLDWIIRSNTCSF